MIRKIGTVALAALVMAAGPAAAQQGQGGGMRMMGGMMGGGVTLDVLKKELAITPEQEPAIQKILEAFQADIKEPRETLMENMQMIRDGVVTREAVQGENTAAMTKIRDRTTKMNEELKGVLTEEQVKKYEAWLEAQRGQMMQRQRPPA